MGFPIWLAFSLNSAGVFVQVEISELIFSCDNVNSRCSCSFSINIVISIVLCTRDNTSHSLVGEMFYEISILLVVTFVRKDSRLQLDQC